MGRRPNTEVIKEIVETKKIIGDVTSDMSTVVEEAQLQEELDGHVKDDLDRIGLGAEFSLYGAEEGLSDVLGGLMERGNIQTTELDGELEILRTMMKKCLRAICAEGIKEEFVTAYLWKNKRLGVADPNAFWVEFCTSEFFEPIRAYIEWQYTSQRGIRQCNSVMKELRATIKQIMEAKGVGKSGWVSEKKLGKLITEIVKMTEPEFVKLGAKKEGEKWRENFVMEVKKFLSENLKVK